MPKPNFLIVGAGRCGTTSLCAYLQTHPDVFISDPKEIGFFSEDHLYGRGMAWYETFFSAAGECKAIGEGSVNYSKRHAYPQAAERIARTLPTARIIYITRHPLEQIVSHWRYSWLARDEELSFSEAVRKRPGYLATCDYQWQVDAFLDRFGPSRVKVLFLEDMKRDLDLLMREVFSFLHLDPDAGADYGPPQNESAKLFRQSSLARSVRNMPGFLSFRRAVPRIIRRKTLAVFNTGQPRLETAAHWDNATEEWVRERVVDRSRAFLERHGKPASFWVF